MGSFKFKDRRTIQNNSKDIIKFLAIEIGERTLRKYDNLIKTRDYIKERLTTSDIVPYEETYTVDGKEVTNVIAEIKGFDNPDEIIVIGAHYDTVEDTPGADDNGSAVAALLELFRLLSPYQYKKTVRFVAFTLEEPPYFSTDQMGSMVHASGCKKRKENIELMVCLEMIGFGYKKCKQLFPNDYMKKDYPPYGNYIAVVSLPSSSQYTFLFKKIWNSHSKYKIFDLIGPGSIPGVSLSDHVSFVKNGFPGIMLTDTGFYRNSFYHTPDDTYKTINFKFLTRNIIGAYLTLREILNMDQLVYK